MRFRTRWGVFFEKYKKNENGKYLLYFFLQRIAFSMILNT
jgi:hypothetical protein